jgi:uncharacterized protein YndB with AHSA1/START domain
MPVKKDPSGRRSVEVETEVPGTPEEVWRMIATGPGISAWFVPTRLEEREGGRMALDFGPGMESKSTITHWDPPRRLAAENAGGMGPGSPTMATEWTVEAKAGGTCRVRVVHSWFASNDDWDGQFESVEKGWPAYFRILKLYLAHFRGQPSENIQLMALSADSKSAAWSKLLAALGLPPMTVGQRFETTTAQGAPRLAGIVEGGGDKEELHLRLDEPTSGVAHFFAMAMGPQAFLSVRFYLYGAQAKAVAAREAPKWQEWLDRLFPPANAPATPAASEATKD